MTIEDSQRSINIGTSGYGSVIQIINGTGLSVAGVGISETSATKQRCFTLRVRPKLPVQIKINPPSFTAAEAGWKYLASRERKRAKKRGLKPSDVDRAIAVARYGK